MKLKVLLFLLVVVFCPTLLFSNTLYFPQVAFGGGYSATFVLVNTGTTAVSARLNFYSQSGAIRGELGTQIDLAAGNSTRFTIPDNGPLTVVWGEINAGSGTLQGVATFDFRTNGRLITSAGVLGVEGNNTFLLPIDVTSSVSATGVAVGNAAGVPLNLSLRLFGENGSQVATSNDVRFVPIPAKGQVADFVTTIFPQICGHKL